MDAETFSGNSLESSEVRNILTLRYNTSFTSNLPKLTWKDFKESEESFSVDDLENLLKTFLEEKLNSNVKTISLGLSGGIDSTLVISLLKKFFSEVNIEATSVKFAGSVDETQHAAKIANYFGIDHHIIHLDNFLKELPKMISITQKPFWDLHWYYVAKEAQKFSKYIATGDGGDELFGGYIFRYEKYLTLVDNESTPLQKVKAYLECHERDWVPDQELLFDTKANFSWDSIYSILLPYFDNPLPTLTQVFLADYNGKLLYNFDPLNAKINNFFGIESLTPLLSRKIISQTAHLPINCKFDKVNNNGKLLLKKLLKKLGTDSFVTEKKLGFSVNTVDLWKYHGHRLCKDYLLDSRIVQDGWIRKDWISKYIDRESLNVRYVNKFLGLLAFEIWYRLFVSKEIKPNETLS